jgi:putative hydrolase of the HAD superfamily
MPRAILLDLYNTLVHGRDLQRRSVLLSMGVDLGVCPDRFADLYVETYPRRLLGALGDLEATVRAVGIAAGGAPTASAVRLAATRRRTFVRDILWPSAASLAALDQLRADGWTVALISNCTVETVEQWPRTPLARRFDAVGFSCTLGVAKPDPAIYLAVCTFLKVAPTDCIYVGDGGDGELPAAANLGMSVIRSEEFLPSTGSWPRQRIAALADLPLLISGPPARSPRSGAPG